ncbi:20545_t:CDS:2, partial [Gigaspora margarita]
PPKVTLVEAIDPSNISTKYIATDHCILWQFDKPLTHRSPWCLDWTKRLAKGIFVFFNDVPWIDQPEPSRTSQEINIVGILQQLYIKHPNQ